MSLQQLKKYILYSILFIGLMLLIYMGIKNIPRSRMETSQQQEELQKLKEELFNCDTEREENSCTNEEVDQIQEKIKSLEKQE
ncbi:MAG: hypothetical protein A3F16_06965 [Deltaproteobacteria bacterium RIFCSPHIGHO2_12_FULL_43_9]|nr:MAG: hypothetical protein A3F16_06965 [Deltaproteobacteria bacterium RIFCSPHIGHO2_12_FULL_43_9]